MHIHPVLNDQRELGVSDPQISSISSEQRKKLYNHESQVDKRKYDSATWHSDIQFENLPADYTSLRLVTLPKTGGDTLWASGYEIYERISEPVQRFLETLSATFIGDGFHRAAASGDFPIYEKPRGSPENIGADLMAIHPVVRTNPVSGWKSIFAVRTDPSRFRDVQ